MREQRLECGLEGCKKDSCASTCCDDDCVEEWMTEYFAFHERMKDHLLSLGIEILFVGDRVKFLHCSDGKRCKFLTHSLNKDVDPRPLDCKIFPFVLDWNLVDFDKKIVTLYYWDESCPLVKTHSIPEDFRQEVIRVLQRDFAVFFHGAQFTVLFKDETVPS